jgi:WD40 repeat protein
MPSPDGRLVLYRTDDGSLWLARVDGGSARRIWASTSRTFSDVAAWSPDSTRFAYLEGAATDAEALHVVGVEGLRDQVVKRLVSPGDTPALIWSSDSRTVRVSEATRSPDGRWWAQNAVTCAYNCPPPRLVVAGAHGDLFLAGSEPTWSPDSRFLASADTDGIHVLDVRSGKQWLLTHDVGFNLAWSPDSRLLAYLHGPSRWSTRGPGEPISRDDLRTVTLSGSVRVVVAADGAYGGPIASFAWTRTAKGVRYQPPAALDGVYSGWQVTALAADGGRVAYATCEGIFVWDSQTGGQVQVETPVHSEPCDPAGEPPDDVVLALAGDRVAYATSHGGNLSIWELGGATLGPTTQTFALGAGTNTCCLPWPEVAGAGGLVVFDSRTSLTPSSRTLDWQIHRVDGAGCPCTTIAEFQHPDGYLQAVHLDDVDANRILVDRPDYLRILDPNGTTLLALSLRPLQAALSGPDLVAHVPGELRDYDATTGALRHSWQIPSPSTTVNTGPTLDDAANGLAVYSYDNQVHQVHLLRLTDGADSTVGPGKLARFMDTGLVYATGTRIHLIPWAKLPLH